MNISLNDSGYSLDIVNARGYIHVSIRDKRHGRYVKTVLVYPPNFWERWVGITWEDKVIAKVRKFTLKLDKLKEEREIDEVRYQNEVEAANKVEEEARQIAAKIRHDVGND